MFHVILGCQITRTGFLVGPAYQREVSPDNKEHLPALGLSDYHTYQIHVQEKNRVGLSSNAQTVNTSQTNLNASWVPFINRGIAEFETSEHLEQQRNTACFGWKML